MLNILNNSILMKITVIDTIRSTIFISQILKYLGDSACQEGNSPRRGIS